MLSSGYAMARTFSLASRRYCSTPCTDTPRPTRAQVSEEVPLDEDDEADVDEDDEEEETEDDEDDGACHAPPRQAFDNHVLDNHVG